MTQSAGHLIVRQLEREGVERAYLVPGESFLDVLDGLYDASVEAVVCRQEGGAGFMALAEGRLTGRPGVAMVTRGPGAANAMIAVHTADEDATALVLFVGLVPRADRYRHSFQEFELAGWFGSSAKRVVVLDDPDHAAEIVRDAMHLASSGRPGPVVVGLPEDVLVETTDAPTLEPRERRRPEPSSAERERFAALLANAERPVIVAGGDGWFGDTGTRLASWAEEAGIPVLGDWRSYDAVPHSSPAYAGTIGYGRRPGAVDLLERSDLHVFVNCVRGDVNAEGYNVGASTPTVVAAPYDERHFGETTLRLDVVPATFVDTLPDPAEAGEGRDRAWIRAARDGQERWTAVVADGGSGVDRSAAFAVLRDRLGGDAVMTYGAGNATLWGHRFVDHEQPNSLVGARNGAMGLAVPAAVAASLVHPERRAVAVCGDGDFFMNGQELAVAVAQGTAPLVVVLDNGVYGTIVSHQRAQYPGRPSGTSMTNPDLAAWVRSYGGHGERVERTEEFADALDRALASGAPALLHLLCDPEVLVPADAEGA